MKPTDEIGSVRYEIREALGSDYPNGKKFGAEECENILSAINDSETES